MCKCIPASECHPAARGIHWKGLSALLVGVGKLLESDEKVYFRQMGSHHVRPQKTQPDKEAIGANEAMNVPSLP